MNSKIFQGMVKNTVTYCIEIRDMVHGKTGSTNAYEIVGDQKTKGKTPLVSLRVNWGEK
jgi:hypothetical protein